MTQVDKGIRAGNFIIDIIVLAFIIVLASYLISPLYPPIVDSNSPAFDVLASTMFFLYYFLLEFLTGKTIGKMLTKTVVVDRNGNKPKILNLIARSLVRLIPIEGISFIFGPTGLHDLISGTRVIKVNKATINKIAVDPT